MRQYPLDSAPLAGYLHVGESVWQFFKTAMFWHGDTLLTPVLVFDQFEELFTLKQAVERTALARELGDLFRGGVPQTMREKRQIGSASPSLGEELPEVKVVLSLREDYLGAIQELTADIPSSPVGGIDCCRGAAGYPGTRATSR